MLIGWVNINNQQCYWENRMADQSAAKKYLRHLSWVLWNSGKNRHRTGRNCWELFMREKRDLVWFEIGKARIKDFKQNRKGQQEFGVKLSIKEVKSLKMMHLLQFGVRQYLKFEVLMDEREHPYSNVNQNKEPEQILYDTIEVAWGNQDQYTIVQKIGRGRYSHVFQGKDTKSKKAVAIKVLLPIRKSKIKREYHLMKSMSHPNIIKMVDIVRCPYIKTASFVFEMFPHDDFRKLYPQLDLAEIRGFMKQLFQGLDYLHSKGIMHRDIKPYNVLMRRSDHSLKIIDFGLSDYYYPSKENNHKVGSLFYKAPELFFENPQYDYRVDCWSAGMIMAAMVFKKVPFLMGNEAVDQLLKLCKLIGIKEVAQYIKQYKLTQKKSHKKDNICFDILIAYEKGDIKSESPSNLEEFINPANESNCTWEALDLLRKLFVLDFKKRFTAKQALEHPFFQVDQ